MSEDIFKLVLNFGHQKLKYNIFHIYKKAKKFFMKAFETTGLSNKK